MSFNDPNEFEENEGFVRPSQLHLFTDHHRQWPWLDGMDEKLTRQAKLVIASCHQENLDDAQQFDCTDGNTPSGRELDKVADSVLNPVKYPLVVPFWIRVNRFFRRIKAAAKELCNLP
jgi:hypothetical protein